MRRVIDFGRSRVAFVTQTNGGRVAVSYRTCRKKPSERTWQWLEGKLSFKAPEAQ